MPNEPQTQTDIERIRAARREYDRKYRETHREQIRANNKRYWDRQYEKWLAETGHTAEEYPMRPMTERTEPDA